jgi:hypothetical protein
MPNIANISNNILTDSGVATSSLQPTITLTTTGTSGASTLISNTLNIPNYGSALTGYVPTSRQLTINGTAYDLSADRTWSVGTVTSVAALTLGTTGTDLSSSVATNTTTPVITLNVPTASAANRGALSSADWTTFNNKQNALTNPVTGTGTSGQVAYFNGTTSITSESNLFWDATNDRLGIGTNIPSQLLHLETTLAGSTGVGTAIQITSGGAGGDQGWIGVNKGTGNGLEISVENRDIIFNTGATTPFGGSEKMRLTNGGNLGLGVTPSAWSGFTAMQVQTLGIWSAANDNYANFSSNSYFDGSNNRYISTQAATLYQQYRGNHYWFQASSGTAGNAISFTQAMTLNASGNLSIGNTNDTYKLDVSGTARFTGITTFGSTGGSGLRVYGGSGTNQWDIYLNGTNLRFSDNTGTGSFVVDRRISAGGSMLLGEVQSSYSIIETTASNGIWLRPAGGTDPTGLKIATTGAATFSSSVTAGGLVTINKINEGLILTAGANTDASYMSTRANNSTGWMIMGSQGTTAGYIQSGTAANESAITTVGAYALSLGTNQVERMRITSGGAVAINYTTAPNGKLYVNGGNDTDVIAIQNTLNTGAFLVFADNVTPTWANAPRLGAISNDMIFRTLATERMRITSGGVVQIANSSGTLGTISASERLNINGDVYSYGKYTGTSFFESSDMRIKTLIQDNYQTKGIASITPKLYTKNGKVELGYYAQDFIGILDNAISKGSDDMLSLSYREVHTAKIYALEQEIKELKAKLN